MCLLFRLLLKVSTSRDGAFEKGGRQVTMGDWVGGNKWSDILKLFKIVKRSLLSKGGLNVLIPLPAD